MKRVVAVRPTFSVVVRPSMRILETRLPLEDATAFADTFNHAMTGSDSLAVILRESDCVTWPNGYRAFRRSRAVL